MQLVKDVFDERVADIESYFELVNNVELAIGSGGAIFSVNGTPYQI
ncbi:hypothetical protein JHL94_004779, partial [Salmonella enterica]|nr:hypothetical protein [Salmonella enterica]